MLAAYRGQLKRVEAGEGYGTGLARDREEKRLRRIVEALESEERLQTFMDRISDRQAAAA
jgi:hypothetical protein